MEDIGGKVYVTYAVAGRANQIAATAGSGVVAVFDENGNFQKELVRGSQLASPWGMALAPAKFGQFSALLPRSRSMNGAPRKINRKHGVNVTHVVRRPPSAREVAPHGEERQLSATMREEAARPCSTPPDPAMRLD